MTGVVMGAAALKRMAPVEFDLFVRALQGLSQGAYAALLASGSDGILGAQGKAQALDQLVKKLEDCTALNEQYLARR